MRKLHLWASFATGVVLLLIVVSGAILVLDPEIHQLTEPQLYKATETEQPVPPRKALATVNRELPEFEANTVIRNRGTYNVPDKRFEEYAYVDPGTGALLGTSKPGGGFMGLLKNLHMCGLTCKEYPGYVPFLKNKFELLGNRLTVGALILGLSGLVLLFMCASGLVLWWPGVKRFARGFRIRRKTGAYSTHYDLHKVVGFVAIPFLAMWAITGMGFEFKQIEDAWYGVMPGKEPTGGESYATFASKPPRGKGREDIGPEAAEQAALATAPGSTPVSVTVPAKDDPKGYYDVWIQDGGIDSYGFYNWPGTDQIGVDRWSGETKSIFPANSERPLSQMLWEDWNFTAHAGTPVGWLPRIAWVLFGLVPVLLAITGISMWLIKRRRRRRKPPAPPSPPVVKRRFRARPEREPKPSVPEPA